MAASVHPVMYERRPLLRRWWSCISIGSGATMALSARLALQRVQWRTFTPRRRNGEDSLPELLGARAEQLDRRMQSHRIQVGRLDRGPSPTFCHLGPRDAPVDRGSWYLATSAAAA